MFCDQEVSDINVSISVEQAEDILPSLVTVTIYIRNNGHLVPLSKSQKKKKKQSIVNRIVRMI